MRKTFTSLLTICTVFLTVHSFAQNVPYYTHYMLNKLAFNPATAGEKDAICVTGLVRQQWWGMNDQSTLFNPDIGQPTRKVNPATQAFTITAPLLKDNKLGVGVQVINDKLGYNTALYLRGSLAYKFGFGDLLPNNSRTQTLAVGADFGMVQIGLDGTKYVPLNPGDPQVPTGLVSGNAFDMGFGLYYTHQRLFNGFSAGASIQHLNRPLVDVSGFIAYQTARAINLHAQSRHDMGSFSLLPSALIRMGGGIALQTDVGVRAEFNQKFQLGVNVRTSDAMALMAGYFVQPNLFVSYSYDTNVLSSTTLRYTRTGSHELFVSYCFDFKATPPPPIKRNNVRYLEGYSIK